MPCISDDVGDTNGMCVHACVMGGGRWTRDVECGMWNVDWMCTGQAIEPIIDQADCDLCPLEASEPNEVVLE